MRRAPRPLNIIKLFAKPPSRQSANGPRRGKLQAVHTTFWMRSERLQQCLEDKAMALLHAITGWIVPRRLHPGVTNWMACFQKIPPALPLLIALYPENSLLAITEWLDCSQKTPLWPSIAWIALRRLHPSCHKNNWLKFPLSFVLQEARTLRKRPIITSSLYDFKNELR